MTQVEIIIVEDTESDPNRRSRSGRTVGGLLAASTLGLSAAFLWVAESAAEYKAVSTEIVQHSVELGGGGLTRLEIDVTNNSYQFVSAGLFGYSNCNGTYQYSIFNGVQLDLESVSCGDNDYVPTIGLLTDTKHPVET